MTRNESHRNEPEHRNRFLSWSFGYFTNLLKPWFTFVSGREFPGKVGSECVPSNCPDGVVGETGMWRIEVPFLAK
ncbi:hypothetical protein TNIN_255431 [Trichonephila inaurata madagascariensis]|uniref:Uncharacterized protein n=1 Tax=Trichonephila inaurata madagascariensis TaxID=2747483 RepID=A0A8X6M8Y9_9ARAC|nr:hypothetical protein TNIN_255431 [Trichonephila inaurata madagascariensis]